MMIICAFRLKQNTFGVYNGVNNQGCETAFEVARTMADEFAIESRTADAIRVRHLAHDHRFIFTVQEHHGRRRLWAGPVMGNAKARLRPTVFEDAARAFAEGEARRAGMID
jgi:hypothetical protein